MWFDVRTPFFIVNVFNGHKKFMAPFGDEVHVGPEIEDINYIAQGFRSMFFDQHFFLSIRLTRP